MKTARQVFFYISLIILVIIFSKQQLHDCVHVTHLVDRLINLFIYTVLLFCFGLFFVVVFTALKHCRPSQGHPSIHYPFQGGRCGGAFYKYLQITNHSNLVHTKLKFEKLKKKFKFETLKSQRTTEVSPFQSNMGRLLVSIKYCQ